MRDQVNAAFVQTAASVLSSAVSAAKAGGLEPAAVLENLSERLQALSERLTSAENAVRAVQDLSSSAQGLVRVSDTLLNDVSSAIAAGQKPIDAAEGAVNAASDAADGFDSGSVALLQGLDRDLALLEQDAGTAFADLDSYQAFVSKDLAGRAALAASMRESAFTAAQAYEALLKKTVLFQDLKDEELISALGIFRARFMSYERQETLHGTGEPLPSFGMVLYENPDAAEFRYDYGDDALNRITEAAVNTFAQNAVDVLTDCPSRERAGWLCDSYFSSRAEALFTGNNLVEKSFLENYALAPQSPYLPEGMIPMKGWPVELFRYMAPPETPEGLGTASEQ